MEQQELKHIESRINEMCGDLATLANDIDFREPIRIIHQPGWTTVAEAALVKGIIDFMHQQTKTLVGAKEALLTGSRAVTLK